MKRIISAFMTTFVLITCVFTTGCSAGEISVTLNGSMLELNQPPGIVAGRTLVPF